MPKSNQPQDPSASKEADLRKSLAMMEAQLAESNRANRELGSQLTEALKGNTELQQQLKELQKKLDVLLAQLKKRNNREYGRKTEKHNPRPALSSPSTSRKKPPNPRSVTTKSTFSPTICQSSRFITRLTPPKRPARPVCLKPSSLAIRSRISSNASRTH